VIAQTERRTPFDIFGRYLTNRPDAMNGCSNPSQYGGSQIITSRIADTNRAIGIAQTAICVSFTGFAAIEILAIAAQPAKFRTLASNYFFSAAVNFPAGLRPAAVQACVNRSPAVFTICSRFRFLLCAEETDGVIGPS
jgi:hypothetical protein